MIGLARIGDWALEALALALMLAVAVGFASYAGRRALVGELAERYLARRGVEADVQVLDVDARGFIGRVRLGPAGDPDFTADRVEVLLAAPPPPEGPYALRPRSILILRPQLKARWTGERLSFGALDPLIEEALKRPSDDDQPGPLVRIRDGRLRLATPYGLVQAGGSAVVNDSRLESLDLAIRPTILAGDGFKADLRSGSASVRVADGAANVNVALQAAQFSRGDVDIEKAFVRLTGRAPYPDLETKRADGPLQFNMALQAGRIRTAGATLRGAKLDGAALGVLEGPISRAAFTGDLDLALSGASATAHSARAQDVRGEVRLADARVEREEDGLVGRGALRLSAAASVTQSRDARLRAPRLSLASAAFTFDTGAGTAGGPLRAALQADEVGTPTLKVNALRGEATSSTATLRTTAGGVRLDGPLSARLRAGRAVLKGQGEARTLDAVLSSRLSLLTGETAPVRGRVQAGRLQLAAADTLALTDARAVFEGRASGGGAFDLRLDVRTRAALPTAAARRVAAGLPVVGDNPTYASAIARLLSGATVSAPDVRLTQRGGQARLTLAAPLQARGPGGALVALTPVGGRVGLGARGLEAGAFRLAASGGGLPQANATVERLRLEPSGVTADLRLRAALDIPLAQGAIVEARGRAQTRNGAFRFTAADCVRVQAAHVELGENDVEALSARLCPLSGAPLIQTNASGYQVRGVFAQTAASVPFLQAKLSAGEGALDASGGPAGLTSVSARIDTAEVTDTAPERRFHPLAITGTAVLAEADWRAALQVLDGPAGALVARANLLHDTATGMGAVDITAEDLRFAPEGLQPHDLSPLAAGLISEANGAVDFAGRLAWSAGALPTSGGRLTLNGVSLDSPAGPVSGLSGAVSFTSLSPLLAPPGQVLTAERIEAFSPLTDVRAEFGLTAEAIQLAAARFRMAGGRVDVEPLTFAFAENRTVDSAVRLDDVDLGALIAASAFADKVQLQAVVDGRIPFRAGPDGLRFADGELHSVRPGRLSIAREALDQVAATGGPEVVGEADGADDAVAAVPPPNAFQDWAYQALENLAYNELEVSVDSRPGGRLGMVFSVKGRHDPPTEQRARISVLDLLRGRAFQRRIPLPSNTPVNLTLDTSLNFDELLATYLELQRERSAPVQSDPAK